MTMTDQQLNAPLSLTNAAYALQAEAVAAVRKLDLKGAEKSLRELCEIEPTWGSARKLRGQVLVAMRRYKQAVPCLDSAIEHFPGDETLVLSKAESLLKLGKPKAALECSIQALRMAPRCAEAHFFRGMALLRLRRIRQAIQSFDQATAISPDFVQAVFNKGVALSRLRAVELVGESVRHEAIRCFDRTIQLAPNMARAYSGRALMLRDLGELDGAVRDCERALELEADRRKRSSIRWLLAYCLVYSGNWTRGWRDWESHLDLFPKGAKQRLNLLRQQWTGQPLAGKTIALHEEGGFGDTIQFLRFAPDLVRLGAQVVLDLRDEMKALVLPADRARGTGSSAKCDYHCSLMSLPALLDVRPETVPGAQGYIRSNPEKVAVWRERLGPQRRLRVGIVWSGNPKQAEDVQRSLKFSDLLPVLGADVEFVCLQKVLRPRDRKDFRAFGKVAFYGDQIGDFTDSAALCETMDLVISTCTSVAHLAGAMGKPVWIMLARNPCWRWMAEGESSPWYESARLFRQERLGEWAPVLRRVREELERVARVHAASFHG